VLVAVLVLAVAQHSALARGAATAPSGETQAGSAQQSIGKAISPPTEASRGVLRPMVAGQQLEQQVFWPSEKDRIYLIHAVDFEPYDPQECQSASECNLRIIGSPLTLERWNQPDYVMGFGWVGGDRVWSDDWDDPFWRPPFPGWPIGFQDADGRANGTTQLLRRVFDLVPPEAGMRIHTALLDMWSDNKSAWWWQGELIAHNRQGYVGQIDLAREHIAPSGGSYVLAVQNSNDFSCADSDYCNPQGTMYRLTVTWRPARRLAYLPVVAKLCRYRTVLAEELDAVIDVRRDEMRYQGHSISDLQSTDFRLTVTGGISTSHHNCGLAAAVRQGGPDDTPELRIISPSHPGVLIGFSYCGPDCGDALRNHVHAEWVGADGQWGGNCRGCSCDCQNGIAIDQKREYTAVLEFRASLGKAVLSVRDESGSLIGEVPILIAIGENPLGVLDYLVLGGSLPRAAHEKCLGWVDSVKLESIDCDP